MKGAQHTSHVAARGARHAVTAPERTARGTPPFVVEGGRFRSGINACAGCAFN
jgi:hypothetical protein